MPPTTTIDDVRKYVDPDVEPGSPEHDRIAGEILSARVQHEQWRASRPEGEQRTLSDEPITHVPDGFGERVKEAEAKRAGEASATEQGQRTLSEDERTELEALRAKAQAGGSSWTP